MKILFMHPNMPGQFKHVCQAFANDPKNQVVFITKPRPNMKIQNIHKIEYRQARDVYPLTHRYLINAERGILQGQEVWRICKKLKSEGFVPDVIVTHPGWGDALYMKDIYYNTPILSFFEFYYHSHGADVGFDPADPLTEDDRARVRTKNIINMMSLIDADWGITPTHWQLIQNPKEFHSKISVIHDGIDTEHLKPNPAARVQLPNGKFLSRGDELITYVARNFEPYRGFPTFMKAAELIQKRRPNAYIVAIGADDVSYGKPPPGKETYRQIYRKQVDLDDSRIFFTGTLAYPDFIKVLQASTAHIYLTYPFVLSWSMLEAMALGCCVIGSKTPPVEEVITHGKNGLLADFFSPEEVADQVDEIFAHKDKMQHVRDAARRTVEERYALSKLLPLHMGLIEDVANRRFPPPTHARIQDLYTDRTKAA